MSTPEFPKESAPEQHRSLADGDLQTVWSMVDFFGSLNNVMRLPEKVLATARGPGDPTRDSLFRRIPRPVLLAMMLVSACVLVGGPLLAVLSNGEGIERLAPAFGVWRADGGRYAGRIFELSDSAVVFSTSGDGDLQHYRINEVRAQGAGDSTLYTVTYRAEQGTSDFAFWLLPTGGLIRFKNAPETVWSRTALSLPAAIRQ
ncbi:MAG TPA: hypothetical protein VFU03_08325 [Gemmatimonadales bacterium]|nr:hypothetical protein [Gemmatimonadales bacterium]